MNMVIALHKFWKISIDQIIDGSCNLLNKPSKYNIFHTNVENSTFIL